MRLTSFQRLALGTTAITYVLILVGGLVRASGAGLGCPDWPRCFGSWVPPFSAADLPPSFDPALFNPTLMWTEYLNRVLGMLVGFAILATCVSAWRHHRREPHILWAVFAAFLLTGFEGWLGGRVVAHELAPWIVTAHLVVALIIVSLLLYATIYALHLSSGHRPRTSAGHRPLRQAVAVVVVLTLGQIALGTQVRGAVDDALEVGTARAQALATAGPVDTWHRDLSLLVVAASVALMALAWSRHGGEPTIRRAALVVAVLAGLQIVIGVVLAYGGLPPPAQVAHLFGGSLLLGAQSTLYLLARWASPHPSQALT